MQVVDRLFIGGEWVAPAGPDTIDVISPHSEEVVGRVPHGSPADMDRAVDAARRVFDEGPWPRLSLHERAEFLGRLATTYGQRLTDMAQTITTEMGSPTSFSRAVQAPMPWMLLRFSLTSVEARRSRNGGPESSATFWCGVSPSA